MAMLDTRDNSIQTLHKIGQLQGGVESTDSALSSLTKLSSALDFALGKPLPVERRGRVVEARGTMIKATGIAARVGEICILSSASESMRGEENAKTDFAHSTSSSDRLLAEVVGVAGEFTLLTPLGDIAGISTVTEVVATGRIQQIPVGEALLGRVLDASGLPMDGLPAPLNQGFRDIQSPPPNPLLRAPISRALPTGVRAIDSLLTCAEGQRIGIFAAAGGGKSTLLGMLARGAKADVVVVSLVGERGREVNEFLEDSLGEEGRKRAVVVVATADRPALERARAAMTATTIAEAFRDQGKRVLLLVDSVTRHARALRDIGLAVGEPPTRRGFPPSVFSALPQLVERAGNGERGSITAFYSILVEDEEQPDPIAEEMRSLLDGHIVLSRKLGGAGHFPAIDVLDSASRVMNRVTTKAHQAAAREARKSLGKYREIELLIQLGEYKPGSDADADEAITRWPKLNTHLRQAPEHLVGFESNLASLNEALK
jgi:ATP synthase in type III secretion protein N